jgi:hypothetical protein
MDASSYTAHVLSDLTFPPQRWVKPVLIGIFGVPGAGKRKLRAIYPTGIPCSSCQRTHFGSSTSLSQALRPVR